MKNDYDIFVEFLKCVGKEVEFIEGKIEMDWLKGFY